MDKNLLTNIVRFFTLLLFVSGILVGFGVSFLLDSAPAQALLVALMCVGVVAAFYVVRTNPGAFAKLMTLCVFVAAILVGLGTNLLVGREGVFGIVILLFSVVLIWGLLVFGKVEKEK